MRSCDGCTQCCKLPGVDSDGFKKPQGEWCAHCAIGQGCKIYENRPTSCKAFACFWLTEERMPDELKPDVCKVLIYVPEEQPFTGEMVDLIVMEDPKQPGRWQSGPVARQINRFLQEGLTLFIVSGNNTRLLKPQNGMEGLFKRDLAKV